MELDELKKSLQLKLEEGDNHRTAEKVEHYIRGRSNSIVAKIKRSMLAEMVIAVVFFPFFFWALLHFPMMYTRFFMALGCFFCIALIFFLVLLYKKISVAETSTPAIRINLCQIISIMQAFIRLYFQITMIMLPVAFLAGILTGYSDLTAPGNVTPKINWSVSLTYYVVFFVAWSILMYFFTKWYIKKLYGNYLQQLKDQLNDLENG